MLLCKIFGHKPPMYGSTASYGRLVRSGRDGTGVEHATVYADCDRCQEEFMVIRIHLPKADDAKV